MYEDFRKRMERKGTYMGEIMRRQSDIVVDALWMNSVSTRPVQVKVINQGLPPTYEAPDDFEDVLWAHFEEHNKFNVTKDEQDCYLTFRPGELAQHPEIKPGSYVCVPNVDNEPEWWLIVYIDNDNELRKTQILKCNWVLKWVANGNIYQTLGCQRVANSYNSGSWDADRLTFVDNIMSVWLPTNKDTQTIGYNQRMLISDEGRYPPIAWQVSKIEDTIPVGITKFRFTQENFDPVHDNYELMLANYYDTPVEPSNPLDWKPLPISATITYSGTKPTIKIGGNFKVFTAAFATEDETVKSWSVSDENGTITEDIEDYIIAYDGNKLKLKVVQKYDLVGKVLIIQVIGTNGSTGELEMEVVG